MQVLLGMSKTQNKATNYRCPEEKLQSNPELNTNVFIYTTYIRKTADPIGQITEIQRSIRQSSTGIFEIIVAHKMADAQA